MSEPKRGTVGEVLQLFGEMFGDFMPDDVACFVVVIVVVVTLFVLLIIALKPLDENALRQQRTGT